jgi:hypothetical protein
VHLAVAPGREPRVVVSAGLERLHARDPHRVEAQRECARPDLGGGCGWRQFGGRRGGLGAPGFGTNFKRSESREAPAVSLGAGAGLMRGLSSTGDEVCVGSGAGAGVSFPRP